MLLLYMSDTPLPAAVLLLNYCSLRASNTAGPLIDFLVGEARVTQNRCSVNCDFR